MAVSLSEPPHCQASVSPAQALPSAICPTLAHKAPATASHA
jgi:hypothetical protein